MLYVLLFRKGTAFLLLLFVGAFWGGRERIGCFFVFVVVGFFVFVVLFWLSENVWSIYLHFLFISVAVIGERN